MSSGFNLFTNVSVTALLGLTPGADIMFKVARRSMIGGAPAVDLWDGPDDKYEGFLPFGVAEQLTIKSDDGDDTAAGAGLRSIFVQGLDENFDIQSKAYAMNGLAGTVTPEKWTRVWRLRGLSAGDKRLANLGNITVTSAAAGTPVMAFMAIGTGTTMSSNFTMPAGHTGVAFEASQGTNNNQIAEINLRGSIISDVDDTFPFNIGVSVAANEGVNNLPILFSVPPLTDIIGEGSSVVGNTDAFLTYAVYVVSLASIGNPVISPLFGGLTD